MSAVNPVLARKLGLAAPSEVPAADPASPLRLMRRAVSRAADRALSLSATVQEITEDRCEVEAMIEDGPAGWVVLGLRDGHSAGLSGLMLIDPVLRQAFVDMQTTGMLLPVPAQPRKVTRTDAALMVPFAQMLLTQMAEVSFGGDRVDPAGYDVTPMVDLRTAGLVMAQGSYLRWRVALHVGGDDVAGEIQITMRLPEVADDRPSGGQAGWSEALRASVCAAEAELEAVLCQMHLPLAQIEAFEVGQVLPMAGTTVGSVTLTGPDRRKVAMARLGQMAGKRAVRLENPSLTMEDGLGRYVPPAAPADLASDQPPPAAQPALENQPVPEDDDGQITGQVDGAVQGAARAAS